MVDQTATHPAHAVLPTPTLQLARPHYKLPQPLTSFVGRAQEQATVQQLLTTERLVTLTGAGGSGKTRLALAVAQMLIAAEQPPFPDGIGWVELAPLADPALVTQAVIATFGLHEQAGSTPLQTLLDAFAPKTLLLVLDNCEHLATPCASLAETLLRACPRLRILTTSREPLGVEGETLWLTPPLAADEAVGLFVERASAVLSGFSIVSAGRELVAHLCQQMDGLPLAIELAAARLKLLSVEQIVARLGNALHLLASDSRTAPTRQRTMQATFDWSYALLTPPEQALFARLAVFAGSFNLEAVEAICPGQGINQAELLDLLTQLLNKSLLVVEHHLTEARYRLLEPVRQYALAKLPALTTATDWRTRHLEWYVALVERIQPELTKFNQVFWLDRLELDLANLRSAFAWSHTDPVYTELGLRLVLALQPFWNLRTQLSEGRRWLAQFLTSKAVLPVHLHARALFCDARLAYNQQDFAAAYERYSASIALCHRAQLPRQAAQALEGLGAVYLAIGEPEKAASILQESLATAQAVDAMAEIGMAQLALGMLAQSQQAYPQAHQHYVAGLACWQALGDQERTSQMLQYLGFLAQTQQDYPTARAYYLECLALHQHKGTKGEARALIGLATILVKQGHVTQAQALYSESVTILRAVNNKQTIVELLNHLARLAQTQGALSEAKALYLEALTLRDQVYKTSIVETLTGLGDLAQVAGDTVQARDHYTQAIAIARSLGKVPIMIVDPADQLLAYRTTNGRGWVEILQAKLADLLTVATPNQAVVGRSRSRHLRPAQPPGAGVLQIFAFGPLRVCVAGRELTVADWVYARAKEVLLYLLLHPSATREEIALEFWPDASPEQVRSRFSAVLAHARKALGRDFDWIPFEDGRYSFNRSGAYWFDVEVFEAQIKAAHKHLRQMPRQVPEAIACLESAIALYQGDFAADLTEGPWYQGKREQLHQAFANALLTLGRLHIEAEHYDQATATYRRALAHDQFLEEAHRELMRCLARQGEPALALRQYETLERILAELDVLPSPETQALIERLRWGERI